MNRAWLKEWARRLRSRLGRRRPGGREDAGLEAPPGTPPLRECMEEKSRASSVVKIVVNLLPIVPLIIAALGMERTLLFPVSILLAVAAFFISPFLVEEDASQVSRSLARVVEAQGLLDSWMCHGRRLVLVALLKNGFVLSVFRRWPGFRNHIVLTPSLGIPLSPSVDGKPRFRVTDVYYREVLEGRSEPGLSLLSTQVTVGRGEVVLPHPTNPLMLTVYRGRTLVVSLTAVETEGFLEERLGMLFSLYESPRARHPAL